VIHLGASVAAAAPDSEGSLVLASSRWAQTTADGELAKRMQTLLAPALLPVEPNPQPWRGEVADWVAFGVPLMSLLGISPLFHTPADLPEQATSPQLLEITSAAANQAVQLFLEEMLHD
jgi:hypothetical protein